jgi:hypothetical protein
MTGCHPNDPLTYHQEINLRGERPLWLKIIHEAIQASEFHTARFLVCSAQSFVSTRCGGRLQSLRSTSNDSIGSLAS